MNLNCFKKNCELTIKLSFMYLGMCVLLPYNILLTTSYEMAIYGVTYEVFSKWESLSISIISCSSLLSCSVFSMIAHKIPLSVRMILSYTTLGTIVLIVALTVKFYQGTSVMLFTGIFCCVIIGISTSLAQGSIFGLSGKMKNPAFSISFLSGMGLSGLVCMIFQVLIKIFRPAAKDDSYFTRFNKFEDSFFVFSMIGTVIIFASLGAIFIINNQAKISEIESDSSSSGDWEIGEVASINSKTETFKFNLTKPESKCSSTHDTHNDVILNNHVVNFEDCPELKKCETSITRSSSIPSRSLDLIESAATRLQHSTSLTPGKFCMSPKYNNPEVVDFEAKTQHFSEIKSNPNPRHLLCILRDIWPMTFTIFTVNLFTFSCFPYHQS